MRLVILSNMAHYNSNGSIVGHGSTAREIDALASMFDEVVHVGCLHKDHPPASALPYEARNVRLVPISPVGGPSAADKLRIVARFPSYARVLWRELRHADVVHVRCPANVSLLAIALLSLRRKPLMRWIKYAGSWVGERGEPLSYRIQRVWLRIGLTRGAVTVNGEWPNQPPHVHTFKNPCLTAEELSAGSLAVSTKTMTSPVQLIFVGNLTVAKGILDAIEVVAALKAAAVACHLTVVGAGPALPTVLTALQKHGIEDSVTLTGSMARPEIGSYLARAHLMLFPSHTEGWPKALSEGMAYGVVPVASAVGSIPHYLARFSVGTAVKVGDVGAFASAIRDYANSPAKYRAEALRATEAANEFSYSSYQRDVRRLLRLDPHQPIESSTAHA